MPRLHPVIWTSLALGVCVGLLSAILGGAFTVRRVQVVGPNLPISAIVQAADVAGQNVFTVQSDAIVARVSRLPDVVVLRVETSFPDQVTIEARRRVAMAAWRTSTGLYLLDPDGRIIGQVRTTTLPVVSGAGTRGPLGSGVVEAVRYAVQTLPKSPNGAIASFQFSAANGLTITGRSGWTAAIGTGTAQKLVDRLVTLAAFLKKIGPRAQQLKYVDLRYPTAYFRYTSP